MQSLTTFRSIEDLVNLLNKERQLLGEMFAKRKLMQFRTDLAREMVQYKEERIRRLIDYNVIHETAELRPLNNDYDPIILQEDTYNTYRIIGILKNVIKHTNK